MSGIFRLQAPLYRAMGLWPRPVWPGAKACQIPHWQKPDPEQPEGALQRWTEQYGDFGIGLVMGSPLPDGTRLGALDIDRDDYLRVVRVLLGDPECGRIGKKGAVFFVRLAGQFHTTPLRVKSEGG
jgi:hypothetical protein